jgi:23S rRNA pseudouridine2605 synthase
MKRRTDNFEKFVPARKNAAIKEQFRQEKKKFKKDRAAAIEVTKQRKLEADIPKPITVKKKITDEKMPLNKLIAHCGVCGRREAALLVKDGKVTVNGKLVDEPGHKVSAKDEVKVNGKKISIVVDLVYILLNKPKDYLTTAADPEGRKTVLNRQAGQKYNRGAAAVKRRRACTKIISSFQRSQKSLRSKTGQTSG